MTVTFAPAFSKAFFGSSNSTCSTPSVSIAATLKPVNCVSAMCSLLYKFFFTRLRCADAGVRGALPDSGQRRKRNYRRHKREPTADERGFEEPFYHKGHKGTRRTNKRERQGRMITDSKRPIRQ